MLYSELYDNAEKKIKEELKKELEKEINDMLDLAIKQAFLAGVKFQNDQCNF
jgi:hypothetical protein